MEQDKEGKPSSEKVTNIKEEMKRIREGVLCSLEDIFFLQHWSQIKGNNNLQHLMKQRSASGT